MAELIVEEELTATRDGLTQLQRCWRQVETDGVRAAVLLVHGLGEHSGRYDHAARFLAQRHFDVLAFDGRGHGQSGGRRGHVDSFSDFLDDVEDLIAERRQLGLPVVLFGHSLGGLISIAYVVSGRPKPDLLVLSAPALGATVPRWQRVMAPVLSRLVPKLFIKVDLDGRLLSSDPEVQRAYRDDPLRVAGSTARLGNEIFTTMAETSLALDRITVPTYVFHGDGDELVPSIHSRPLADLPNVTYRLWPGLRHECLNEPSQDEVLGGIDDWLSAALEDLGSGSSEDQ